MTNKQIEEAGNAAINSYFSRCEHISANLSQNDKTPLWDGELFLYQNSNHNIANLIGPVKVQVKSHNKVPKGKVKQTIPIVNLKSYKDNGGILYFSVFVGDENAPRIFYKALTQVLIKKYIKSANGHKDVKIPFEELPNDKTVTENLVLDFYEQCHLQTPLANTDIISIDDYFKKQGKKKFNVSTRGFKPISNFPEYLRNNQVYLYETDDQGRVTNVIGDGPVYLLKGSNKVRTITAGKHQFKMMCTAFTDGSKLTINLDRFIVIEHDLETNAGKITYNESDHLSRQKLVEFMLILAINEAKSVQIDKFKLSLPRKWFSEEKQREFESKVQILRQFHELLDCLHIAKDIRLEDLSEDQIQTVGALYSAIVEKKTISLVKPINKFQKLALDKITLLIASRKEDNGEYTIQDYFDPTVEFFCVKDQNTNAGYFVNRISALNVKDFEELDNIFFDNIVPEYKKIAVKDNAILSMANNDMLKLLNAYDEMQDKRVELLSVAEQIVDWLTGSESEIDADINKINKYQIVKRRRNLTTEENEELYAISETSSDENIKIGALLLSENYSAARSHFSRLPKKDQDFFITLPIYHFWK